MSLYYVPTGSWTISSNSAFYPPRQNWLCKASSLESKNQTLLSSTLTSAGYFTVSESTTYDLIFNFVPADIGYRGSGSIGLLLTDSSNQQNILVSCPFTSGNNTTARRNITLQQTFTVCTFITLETGGTFTFSTDAASFWRVDMYTKIRGVMYNSGSSLVWEDEERPLRLTATLTSGYKVTFYATHDATSTGLAIFKKINSFQATAVCPSPSSNTSSTPSCSIDSISSDLKTIVVNVITGTTITTLLASSQITTTNATPGTIVYLSIWGI